MEALTLTNVRWTGDTNAKMRFPVCYDSRWDCPWVDGEMKRKGDGIIFFRM